MKLAIIATGLDTGGAEMALLRLLPAMRSSGIESIVVSLRSMGEIGPKLRDQGISVTALGLPSMVACAVAWSRMLSVLRGFAPMMLHGWMYHGNLAALAAARRLGLPVAWGIRQSLGLGTRDKWFTRRVIDAGAWLSRRAGLIIYNSAIARSQHESRGYSGEAARVVPNGFDTEAFRPDPAVRVKMRAALGLPPGAPVVIQVARYHPGKDYPTLLRAAARVVERFPLTRFLLVGGGVDKGNSSLMALVDELRLGPHVRLLGRRDDIGELLCAADVATLTSAGMEGFPNALGEAMSCGVPCVGTDVGDVPQLIGNTGAVVPPSEPEAVAAEIMRMISLPLAERQALGAKARQRVIDEFSIGQVAIRYAGLLAGLASR